MPAAFDAASQVLNVVPFTGLVGFVAVVDRVGRGLLDVAAAADHALAGVALHVCASGAPVGDAVVSLRETIVPSSAS